MRKLFVLIFVVTGTVSLYAQDYAGMNNSYQPIDSSKVKTLDLRFESLGFFLNNEYMGKIVDGYTWPGAWVRPKLIYTFTEKLKLELGWNYLRYHSRDDATISRPWISAEFQMFDQMKVVFGDLNQNGNHGLLKQMWEPERIMTDAPKEGIQFLFDSKYVKIQNWMSWEQFILPNDPWQEHFTFGLTSDAQLYSNSNITVKFPFQLMVYHKGGEIDSSPLEVVTHYNYATGLELGIETGDSFFKKIDFNSYWLGYNCPDGPSPFNYNNGHGISIVASTDTKLGRFTFDYWNAYQFVSPFGRKLYQSFSDNTPGYKEDDRSMIAFNYTMKQHITENIHFAFQGEAFYDLLTSRFSFGFGYYLLINQDFLLKRFK